MFSRDRSDLTPAQQFMFLRANPICAGIGRLHATGLIWDYRHRPTPLSREYTMRIKFQRGETPSVFVTDPDLSALAGGRPLPHVYHDPLRLCLTLPGTREWAGTMRIDQTFVPWATTWLYYFEEWLISDEWKGGGKHPDATDDERYSRRVRRATR
ncbi:MAG TPA: hypothetical protein VNQ56_07935 [Pseudolabrys sp.]|nr:hypothetical protein [Pseudolabrys sp.]